jgi:glycosyltransferase involved in cell wall biosynthesis
MEVTALTVSYNTPDYLDRLLSSFRRFYDIPYMVIDGSDKENWEKIKDFDKKYDIELIHFDYNIHHGPGLAYGIKKITTPQALLVDSDIIIHSKGWLEIMTSELKKSSYGSGDIQKEYYMRPEEVNKAMHYGRGRDRRRKFVKVRTQKQVWIDYLHPAFALINREIALQFPMPIKGGAPLIMAMKAIDDNGLSKSILQRSDLVTEDFWKHTKKYIQHNEDCKGMGTVVRTGGYHLEP